MALLPVPYIAQRGNAPANDCGPACCLMLSRWMGRALTVTVAEWSRKYDAEDNGTTAAQLQAILRDEVALTPTLGRPDCPHILLVNYTSLPVENRSDKTGRTFTHWIVRLSDTTYHDPYHFGNAGANLTTTKAVLDAARIGTGSKVGIVERPFDIVMANKYKAQIDGARVRTTPDIGSTRNIVGVIPGGSVFDADVATESGWLRVKLAQKGITAGDVTLTATAVSPTFDAFVSTAVATPTTVPPQTTPPPPPTPTPAAAVRVGANVLLPGSDQNAAMNAFYNGGCRYMLVMNDELAAIRMANLGVKVLFRWYHNYLPSAQEFLGKYTMLMCDEAGYQTPGKNKIHPNIYPTGLNEADQMGNNTADQVRKRSELDKQLFAGVKQMGGTFAGGTFSVGNPEIGGDYPASKECEAAMRECYAPLYNAGMFLDYHSYSPRMNPTDADWLWHNRRWEFFFTRCGFNPQIRGIVSGETGVDEGGVGGFPAHNATSEQVVAWCNKYIAVQSAPLIVNGVSYTSPFLFGVLFQASNSGSWAGYDVRGYLSALSASLWSHSTATSTSFEAQAIPDLLYVYGSEDVIGNMLEDVDVSSDVE